MSNLRPHPEPLPVPATLRTLTGLRRVREALRAEDQVLADKLERELADMRRQMDGEAANVAARSMLKVAP